MKKLALALIALLAVAAVAPAAQQHAKPHHSIKMAAETMDVRQCCMQGLSAAEQKTAMGMMKSATPAEHAAMMKRCSMCMKDPHTALAKMDPSKITEKMKMDHMMAGMTKSEQKTMMKMMAKMTPDQKAVCEKMCMNCCMYGMKHAKHK